MCHEYEFEWYEQARTAEKERREREQKVERDAQPSKAPAKPDKDVKRNEPVPA
jgi:hypothetical protein